MILRIAAFLLVVCSTWLVGCSKKNEAATKRAIYEAEGWEFLETVGMPVEDGVFMAAVSTDGMSTNASLTAIGLEGANRVERKYSSEDVLFLVAGFQSPTSGGSYSMVFKRPRPKGEKWWSVWMTEGKVPEKEITLGPAEKKVLVISRDDSVRLGVLVREALEMKRGLEAMNDSNGRVYLTQNGSGKYVGTYLSASVVFDLSLGREFTVENRSPVASEVVVFLDPAP